MTAVSPTRESADSSIDLENWMTNLPENKKSRSIKFIAIPGSHDSMTYPITKNSKISPDAEYDFIKKLKFLKSVLGFFVSKWAKTQGCSATQQLNGGIRYFDLRVSTKRNTEDIYFVHSQYADRVQVPLEEILLFLNSHPKEIVILDCQHFYEFNSVVHQRFIKFLTTLFKDKLLPYSSQGLDDATISYMNDKKYQVILIYRSDTERAGQPLLWSSRHWPNPWPNTVSINQMFSYLDRTLKERNLKYGHISQCLLTPSAMFVTKNLFSNLKKQCAIPVSKRQSGWIEKQQTPNGPTINVIIVDFSDLSNYDFCKTVVQLNYK